MSEFNINELLQALDPTIALYVVVGCGLLCVVGIVLLVVLQFVGIGVEIVVNVIQFIGDIIAGGPIAWCGCFLFLLVCGSCGFSAVYLASIIPKCGTPEAIRLCRFLGY